jgi:hypothetical protein
MADTPPRLGYDFWGRAILALFSVCMIVVGARVGDGGIIFGSVVAFALFSHLAYLRFAEFRIERQTASLKSAKEEGSDQ